MRNIDKRELREAADLFCSEEGDHWWDEKQLTHEDGLGLNEAEGKFIATAKPATVLALLDEMEAAEKRIAELEASHGNLREAMAGIHNTITGRGAHTPLAAILNASKRAYEESAAAAGKGDAS